ncbi:MAG: helix-turn-helix domain-containing protein [Deltaproteobacteria bacterium]|nr:helix-turn-helix domain-containing protein [Deltaproteobacteria bacterium]
MTISDYFRLAIVACLDTGKWGSQTKLANRLNIDRSYLNQILRGKRKIAENHCLTFSDYLGYKYEDIIRLGRKIAEMSEIFGEQIKLFKKHISPDLYKEIRERKGYTQKEFARMLGISELEYEFKEKGVLPFILSEIHQIMNLTEQASKHIKLIEFDKNLKIIQNLKKELNKLSEEEKIIFLIRLKEEFSKEGETIKECYKMLRRIRAKVESEGQK